MKTRFILACACVCAVLVSAQALSAAPKTIYIKPFSLVKGLPATDPAGNLVKDYVSEAIIEMGGFAIISDDEVKQTLQQEELRMSMDICYDDACMKQLMQSIQTDYIIYGTIALDEGRYTITAKMLDRSGGTVQLARVKTLEFKGKKRIKVASHDLAAYMVKEKSIRMERYAGEESEGDDEYQVVVLKTSSAVSLSYNYFMPFATPFKDYYDGLNGISTAYYRVIGVYTSLVAGANFLTASDNKTGNASVSLTSGFAGIRLGMPVLGILYPYAGILAKGTWFREKGQAETANLLAYGVDGFAGVAVNVWENISVFADFRAGWAQAKDKAGTSLNGGTINIGTMYGF